MSRNPKILNASRTLFKFSLVPFFKLVRINNLLMIVALQGLFVYVFTDKNLIEIIKFMLLVGATVFLAAAGNVINDYFDVKSDTINKPNKVIVGKMISKRAALFIYYLLNVIGIISGIILAYLHHKIIYSLLFIGISVALYYYSKHLKGIALLGNFVVSLLIALSIFLIYLFPPFKQLRFQFSNYFYLLITSYTAFAFMINFLREILKDIEDIDGDYVLKMKTLPIIIGRKRTKNILFYLSAIPFMAIIFTVSVIGNNALTLYAFIFLIIPFGYFIYQIKEVKSQRELHKLSTLLKLIMLFGLFSILFFH